LKEEGQGASKRRRMDGVLEDWRNLGIQRWLMVYRDKDSWKEVVREAETRGLQR